MFLPLLLSAVRASWTSHSALNCYPGRGAPSDAISNDRGTVERSLDDCHARCDKALGCTAITARSQRKWLMGGMHECWLRGSVDVDKCAAAKGYVTHVRVGATPSSPAAVVAAAPSSSAAATAPLAEPEVVPDSLQSLKRVLAAKEGAIARLEQELRDAREQHAASRKALLSQLNHAIDACTTMLDTTKAAVNMPAAAPAAIAPHARREVSDDELRAWLRDSPAARQLRESTKMYHIMNDTLGPHTAYRGVAQAWQDVFVWRNLFARRTLDGERGFFVESGLFKPVHGSNTFFFEKIGWSGLCVEPNDKVCSLAVGLPLARERALLASPLHRDDMLRLCWRVGSRAPPGAVRRCTRRSARRTAATAPWSPSASRPVGASGSSSSRGRCR